MAEIHCRHFSGYKPCDKSAVCRRGHCASYESVNDRILIVHLEALGAVLRSTSLLKAIRRRYPKSHLTWVTKAPAHHLLANVKEIDRVLTTSSDDLLRLSALEFDVGLLIDKSLAATGVALKAKAVKALKGFRADGSGAIVPANAEAVELWELGLSNEKKFFENKKTEQRLVHEALELGPYERDDYIVRLTAEEKELAAARRKAWSPNGKIVIGLNTGCSPTLPHKKLSVENHRHLIAEIKRRSEFVNCPIVLLGGPEDTERNREIAKGFDVIVSPTTQGLRDGLASVEACDLIVTGDSLGMHMAIGLGKWVAAWFGPTCQQEIDLYGRGVKILTKAPCSPCWKRDCQKTNMCYDQVDLNEVIGALVQGKSWLISSSKPLSPEMFSSPSPSLSV